MFGPSTKLSTLHTTHTHSLCIHVCLFICFNLTCHLGHSCPYICNSNSLQASFGAVMGTSPQLPPGCASRQSFPEVACIEKAEMTNAHICSRSKQLQVNSGEKLWLCSYVVKANNPVCNSSAAQLSFLGCKSLWIKA